MTSYENTEPLNINLSEEKNQQEKPKSGLKKFLSNKIQLLAIAGCSAFFILLIVYLYQATGQKSANRDGSSNIYNNTYPFTKPVRTGSSLTFRIGAITDLDKSSIDPEAKNSWKAYIKRGYLSYNPANNDVVIKWDRENAEEPRQLTNGYSYKGRGIELSELVVFNGKLLTFDDKTGIVFQVENQSELVPWLVLADADGTSSKGFKCEWATVKDAKLYIGSHGQEESLPGGKMGSLATMFVKIVTSQGQVSHINWVNEYHRLREARNISWPGYMIHESGVWSHIHNRWFFLPRKCVNQPYDPILDGKVGCNVLLSADENIFDIKVVPLKTDPARGYSSFKFVPTSQDSVIVALRTTEIGDETATYVSAFTVSGQILLNDTLISDLKYEGIEFI